MSQNLISAFLLPTQKLNSLPLFSRFSGFFLFSLFSLLFLISVLFILSIHNISHILLSHPSLITSIPRVSYLSFISLRIELGIYFLQPSLGDELRDEEHHRRSNSLQKDLVQEGDRVELVNIGISCVSVRKSAIDVKDNMSD